MVHDDESVRGHILQVQGNVGTGDHGIFILSPSTKTPH